MRNWKKPEAWISAAGLAGLAAAFLIWLAGTTAGAAGKVAALCSAALFAAVCLRFVPVWLRSWRRAPQPETGLPEETQPRFIEAKLFGALLLTDAAVVLLVYLLRRLFGHTEPFAESLAFWKCTDSGSYLDIARDWYLAEGSMDRLVQLVFLPGYPLAIRLLHLLIPDWLLAGMAVSFLSFAGAGCVLYRLFRLDLPHRDALRAVRYFCILPGAFFFAAPMSESLFLLLCAACLYCARTGRWLPGCLLGGCAAFTRSLGLTLAVPLFFELVSAAVRAGGGRGARMKRVGRLAALLLIPAGFGVYCWINWRVSGNPFQFMIYQNAHWSQRTGWFFNTASYQLEEAVRAWGTRPDTALGLWIPNLLACFASLVLMLFSVKKLRPSYTAWFLVYYLIAIGATWLLSAPRYLLALIPVPLAVSRLAESRRTDVLLSALCLAPALLYLCAFVLRWQVW
jgi:hypothetical protein